jgi:hypothetical protein
VKAIVILLVIAVIALAVFLFRQNSAIAVHEERLAAIFAELSAKRLEVKSPPLDLQAKCSDQARKAFTLSGLKESEGATYQNHYNVKLNKCFIETQNQSVRGKTIWTFRNVYDAFEGRLYGTYAWHTEDNKKYWEVKPTMCEVELRSGENQTCQSDEEFSKLVQGYMVE